MGESIIKVENIALEFNDEKATEKRVLSNVTFDIYKNEILGIIGNSGCGKTVLSLAILGFIATNGRLIEGTINYNGNNIFTMNKKDLQKYRRNVVSNVFQIPQESFDPLKTIWSQLLETLSVKNKFLSKKDKYRIICEYLTKVHLEPKDVLKKYPFQLSGGTLQRIAICSAMLYNPSILIADEITSSLDIKNQTQIIELLLEVKAKNNMSIVFITHDIGVALKICDRVIIMENGTIIECDSVDIIKKSPKHDTTRKMIDTFNMLHK